MKKIIAYSLKRTSKKRVRPLTEEELTDSRLTARFPNIGKSSTLLRTITLNDSQEMYHPITRSQSVKGAQSLIETFSQQSSQFEGSSDHHNVALSNARIAMILGRQYQESIAQRDDSVSLPDKPFTPDEMRPKASFGCSEFKNQSKRPAMEDAVCRKKIQSGIVSGLVFGVFDGHGIPSKNEKTPGKIVADFFAAEIPVTFQEELTDTNGRIEISLLRAFKKADEQAKTDRPEAWHSGSTGLVAFIPNYGPQSTEERFIYLANCGDSRAILCTGSQADQLTLDHELDNLKPSEIERLEAGAILKNGRVYPKGGRIGLNMPRTLGNWAHAGDTITHAGHRGAVSGTPDIYKSLCFKLTACWC